MDFDEKRKRQMIRVIIAEVGMVLAVIAIVIVSLMAAMGFMISSNGSIEQTGLMQLHTLPTGASVKIDGATVFGRTNLSRTLSAGEHSLEIYRDGYDTWQNTVKVRSGVLIRLYYPRLFLVNRAAEPVMKLTQSDNLDFYQASPRKSYVVYAEKGASKWQLLDLRGDEIKESEIDVKDILPGIVLEKSERKSTNNSAESKYVFSGKIEEIRWSDNEENLLVKATYEEKSEWILVRLKDLIHSVNLSRIFGLSKNARLELIDSSATQLYVLENRQLRRINTVSSVMSRILVDNVIDFMNDETKVIYLRGASDGTQRTAGVFRDDESGSTTLVEIADGVKTMVALTNYYDDDYMMWTEDQKLNIVYGRLPSYSENSGVLEGVKSLVDNIEYEYLPESLFVSPGGEYLLAKKDKDFMVVDLDDGELFQYETQTGQVQWFDDSMLYAIEDGQIAVWDFDGMNWRNLSKDIKLKNTSTDVKVNSDSPVTVSASNRYIYYLTTSGEDVYLTREQIRD